MDAKVQDDKFAFSLTKMEALNERPLSPLSISSPPPEKPPRLGLESKQKISEGSVDLGVPVDVRRRQSSVWETSLSNEADVLTSLDAKNILPNDERMLTRIHPEIAEQQEIFPPIVQIPTITCSVLTVPTSTTTATVITTKATPIPNRKEKHNHKHLHFQEPLIQNITHTSCGASVTHTSRGTVRKTILKPTTLSFPLENSSTNTEAATITTSTTTTTTTTTTSTTTTTMTTRERTRNFKKNKATAALVYASIEHNKAILLGNGNNNKSCSFSNISSATSILTATTSTVSTITANNDPTTSSTITTANIDTTNQNINIGGTKYSDSNSSKHFEMEKMPGNVACSKIAAAVNATQTPKTQKLATVVITSLTTSTTNVKRKTSRKAVVVGRTVTDFQEISEKSLEKLARPLMHQKAIQRISESNKSSINSQIPTTSQSSSSSSSTSSLEAFNQSTPQNQDDELKMLEIESVNRMVSSSSVKGFRGVSTNRLSAGCTGLMYACQHGDFTEVFKQLHSKPESVYQRDKRNKNALHYCTAASIASVDKSDLVAAASIAVAAPELLESADEDGFTPLHLAVIQGNLAMVNLLLANKADVNAVDNEGHSVVHWATVCGEVEALRAVLAAGANVSIPDINGGTPLHYAAQMCGANYEGRLNQNQNSSKLALDILEILLKHPKGSVDVEDKDGRQPLLWAASAGSAKAITALVKSGARVESSDKDGLTALHCAASRGHTECIDTLVSLCGAPTDLIDTNGCTALHYAVTLGHADATARLLDLEADPNRQDRKGRTPAHCGCSKGQLETVKLLKERGANLWLRNARGDLPLHEAASSGRRELVEWLLDQRPKQVNTTSNDGRSMLHIAAANDFTHLCKLLLDFGGDVNALYRNSKGVVITPLDCALHKGHRSTAKFLQSHGGLPASKLRMAARRANPFQDATMEAVRPLKYMEKEEIHDLKNSKTYVVYMKRSDSEAEIEGKCSCTEQPPRKEERVEHVCRRHQRKKMRRRTSSCGERKQSCGRKDCANVCRSKSNIELRRRRSCERYASSTEWEDDEEDEDSCENCCYHKKEKQRVLRKRQQMTPSKRSRGSKDSDNETKKSNGKDHYSPRMEKKDESSSDKNKRSDDSPKKREKGLEMGKAMEAEEVKDEVKLGSRPSSSVKSRPQSASRRRTPASPTKGATFIKSPPTSAKSSKDLEDEGPSVRDAVDFTDEEIVNKGAEVLTTQVDVHREAETNSLKPLSEEEEQFGQEPLKTAEEDMVAEKDKISEELSKEVNSILDAAQLTASQDSEEKTKSEVKFEESQNAEEALDKTKMAPTGGLESLVPELKETPATPSPGLSPAPTVNASRVSSAKERESSEDKLPAETSKEGEEQPPEAAKEKDTKQDPLKESFSEEAESKEEKPSEISDSRRSSKPLEKEEEPLPGSQREQESRRSFTLLPSDSADDEEPEEVERKSSFQVLKSDDSALDDLAPSGEMEMSDSQVFKVINETNSSRPASENELSSTEESPLMDHNEKMKSASTGTSPAKSFQSPGHRLGIGAITDDGVLASTAANGLNDLNNGRKRRLKKRVKSGSKTRSHWKGSYEGRQSDATGSATQHSKDQDSGFEPSPRTMKSKIPTPRNIYTAYIPSRKPTYATLDRRSCASRFEHRKLGDKAACDMSAVTRSIQRNIRRYYMERKIFQHLLELKSLQIRSNKLNEAVLVKRAVDDYHKSCSSIGGETGTRLRRYNFSEYTFKNFELFLYETLKALQKPGTYNFQNINEVYEEAERRLSPDTNAYVKALQCTSKTHRCLHAAHAYTGIPCAAYIPMMNHHTMPKLGFGPYKKSGVGSFYLPKILTSSSGCGGKVALEVSHGKSKQLISLPSDKLDSNKRYYVTFTVKDPGNGNNERNTSNCPSNNAAGSGLGEGPSAASVDCGKNNAGSAAIDGSGGAGMPSTPTRDPIQAK